MPNRAEQTPQAEAGETDPQAQEGAQVSAAEKLQQVSTQAENEEQAFAAEGQTEAQALEQTSGQVPPDFAQAEATAEQQLAAAQTQLEKDLAAIEGDETKVDLAHPEFAERADAQVLAGSVDEITGIVDRQATADIENEKMLAQQALDQETSGGFLQGIKESKFFKRFTALAIAATIVLSIAATAKAEAGPAPIEDTPEDVDPLDDPEESYIEAAKKALDSYKQMLHPDHYQKLENCVNDVLDSELPDNEKDEAIGELFNTLLETSKEAPAASDSDERLVLDDKKADHSRDHNRTMDFWNTYLSAEVDADRGDLLEEFGSYKVQRALEMGVDFSDGYEKEYPQDRYSVKLTVTENNGVLNCTMVDTDFGDTVNFEIRN